MDIEIVIRFGPFGGDAIEYSIIKEKWRRCWMSSDTTEWLSYEDLYKETNELSLKTLEECRDNLLEEALTQLYSYLGPTA